MKKNEVLPAVIKYFGGDELSASVWIDKYALKDRNGSILERTPDDMHRRMANELGRIESNYPNAVSSDEIYELMKDFKYIVPQGSPMYGIGNNNTLTSLSNCFVVGNNDGADSYGSIMRTDEEQIQLMKRRGGVGHDISHLRPGGSLANNSILGGLAGSTLYMDRYSNSTREVAQDGRRGALMLSIDVRHPDSERFIDAKLAQGKVTGANISVKLRDDFMDALENGQTYLQRFPIDLFDTCSPNIDSIAWIRQAGEMDKLYPVKNDDDKVIGYVKKIDAKHIWNKIIGNAHQSAEPGVFFWDKILSESPADCYGGSWKTLTTNPCVVGNTIIKTDKGDIEICEIVKRFGGGESFNILSYNKDKKIMEYKPLYNAQKTKENAEILEIETETGDKIRLTPDHKVFTEEDGWVEAANLTINHTILRID